MPYGHTFRLGPHVIEQPLGIGTMQWGVTWIDGRVNRGGVVSDTDVDQAVEEALSHGITFFDSAEGYGGGTSEERIRAALERRRLSGKKDKVSAVVATKFLPTIWRYSRESFLRALRGCLDRLGAKKIDVFFIHSPVHPLPLERWVEAACDAADMGLIDAIGLSNCGADQVRRAVRVASARGQRISSNQIMLNLLCYNSRKLRETEAACREAGVTIVAFCPVGQGLLTDTLTRERFDDGSIRAIRITGMTWDELQPLRARLRQVADAHGKTMAQVALNWTIAHGHIPLVGCKNKAHVAEAAGCLGWEMTPEELKSLDALAMDRSTLEKPRWRRGFFLVLISTLILAYRLERFLSRLGLWACSWVPGAAALPQAGQRASITDKKEL
eukprot:jgi/Mesvir1/3482/Mv11973-RA.1